MCYNKYNRKTLGVNFFMDYMSKLNEILESAKTLKYKDEKTLDSIKRKIDLYDSTIFNDERHYGRQSHNIPFWAMVSPCTEEFKHSCWVSGQEKLINLIETMKEDYEMISNSINVTQEKSNNKVFIVHGRDDDKLKEVELFVHRIGLEPIILREQASRGKSIIEKIEAYSDVAFAIVLYTACDVGKYKNDEDFLPRARQNVVFEHGYMVAHLKRENVIALIENGIDIPGDWSGVVYTTFDNNWKQDTMKEMAAAGLKFDWSKA